MDALFERSLPLLGEAAQKRLKESHVAVFGLGGVGGAAAEALVRAGVGQLTFIDGDIFVPSNLNRQILATTAVLDRPKAQVAAERAKEINPQIRAHAHVLRYGRQDPFDLSCLDYLADCIDDTDAKLFLMEEAQKSRVPLISSMGAAGRLDPSLFRLGTLYTSFGCPLAKKLRALARAKGLADVEVVFSPEPPKALNAPSLPSVSFVPPVAGYLIAGAIIKQLCGRSA